MNRFLIRFYLIAILLCGFLDSTEGVMAKSFIEYGRQESEHQVKQDDGYLNAVAEEPQSPIEVVFRSARSSHRVASNRPTRLLPTHGGKPGKYHGRWATDEVYKSFKIATLQLCRDFCHRYIVAAFPRLRYVIALRRLLC